MKDKKLFVVSKVCGNYVAGDKRRKFKNTNQEAREEEDRKLSFATHTDINRFCQNALKFYSLQYEKSLDL